MKLAVYCASGMGYDPTYAAFARELGQWIAANGHTLIYGGGDAGLMGEVAHAAHDHGSTVIGVLPSNVDFICSRPQPWCTQVIMAQDMPARKKAMLQMADAFLVLPGGIGTLDEVSETITLTKIGVFHKASILLNVKDFYAPLKLMLSQMEEKGFIEPGTMNHVCFADDLDAMQAFLAAYYPAE